MNKLINSKNERKEEVEIIDVRGKSDMQINIILLNNPYIAQQLKEIGEIGHEKR